MCIDHDEEVRGRVAAILVVETLDATRFGRDGCPSFADELAGRLIEAHDRPSWVQGLGVQVEDVLHAGHELGVHCRDAPHLALPGFDLHGFETTADCLVWDALMFGQDRHPFGEQGTGPPRTPLGRRRTCGRHKEGLVARGQLSGGAWARLLIESRLEPLLYESLFQAIDRRGADAHVSRDHTVASK